MSVFDVRTIANCERLFCSSLNKSQKAAVRADVENQSVFTNPARPGRGTTQLSAVLAVVAAGPCLLVQLQCCSRSLWGAGSTG